LFGGDWTEEKLGILARYLADYNTALKKMPFIRVYIDAFAGTGYREQKRTRRQLPDLFAEIKEEESQVFLKGSAKRALEVRPSFHKYIFVESEAKKIAELERLKEQHPEKAGCIDIVHEDANEFVGDYCHETNWTKHRAVLFLDPFATEVAWITIEAIAATRAIDTWILFPLMAVNRLLANDPERAFRERLDHIFGTEQWFEAFYRTRRMEDIFGQPLEIVEKCCDFSSIGEFFSTRLKSIFAKVAPTARAFRNSMGTPLFQFFFAAANPKGAGIAVRIADHILGRM